MGLEKHLENIKNFLLKRYQDNLAAILIFGSVNTGHFIEGKSDIDHIIFLKKLNGLDLNKETEFLLEKLKKEYSATQYFNSLEGFKDYIRKRKSFSTYITIVSGDGSRVIYSTPEFEKFRKNLKRNPLTQEDLIKYIKEKDEFELRGYFNKIRGYNLTKSMMAHIRRKMQIINYLKNKSFIFDYEKCLRNMKVDEEEKRTIKNYIVFIKKERVYQKQR